MLSYELMLVSQPLIFWNFAYKNWITSKMLLINGPDEYLNERRRIYTRRYIMFTVFLIVPSLVFGPWLAYLDLYAKVPENLTDDHSLCWKYHSLNLAMSDSVSAIVMLFSLRNFNIARKQQIIAQNSRKK